MGAWELGSLGAWGLYRQVWPGHRALNTHTCRYFPQQCCEYLNQRGRTMARVKYELDEGDKKGIWSSRVTGAGQWVKQRGSRGREVPDQSDDRNRSHRTLGRPLLVATPRGATVPSPQQRLDLHSMFGGVGGSVERVARARIK